MAENKKFCQYCGHEVDTDAVVCVNCGKQLKKLESEGNTTVIVGKRGPYSKWTAFVLCFFLGALGIHKFYEGKTGMGILYIFTVGLFGIGVLVDLIKILCGPDPYYV